MDYFDQLHCSVRKEISAREIIGQTLKRDKKSDRWRSSFRYALNKQKTKLFNHLAKYIAFTINRCYCNPSTCDHREVRHSHQDDMQSDYLPCFSFCILN